LPPILWYIELLESAELQAELGVGYQTDRGEGATEGAEVLYAEMAEAGINCLGDEIVIQGASQLGLIIVPSLELSMTNRRPRRRL